MRKTGLLLITLLLAVIMAGCTGQQSKTTQTTPEKVVIQAPVAPPSAPLLQLAADQPLGPDTPVELIFYKSVEEATARIIKGEAHLSILPLNVAAKLYNKDTDVKLANVSTWGLLYLVSSNNDINQWADLPGKQIAVGAQGASPDIITRYLLAKNNVPVEDLTITYASSPEIAQMMVQGMLDTAVLPEPLVTNVLAKKPDVRIVMDFNVEWQRAEAGNNSLPQAGMVVLGSFAEKYPHLLDTLQSAYRQAIEQVVENPASISSLVEEKFDIPAPIFEQSMGRTKLAFATAQQAKPDAENYLAKLLAISPDMVGGQLPDDNFYLAK